MRRRIKAKRIAGRSCSSSFADVTSKGFASTQNDSSYTPDIVNQNSLFLILAAPACAWVAGLGLFKTLLLMSVMHRYVPNGAFSGPLSALGDDPVFYLVSALAAVEIIVDFIPRWDIAWDRWTAHLRIIGGAVLAYQVLYSETMDARIMMAVVGAALAATSFTAKTAARKASMRGQTDTFVRPVSAVTEDCMIVATLLPLTKLPPMTLLMVAFMAMAAMLVMYVIRNETRETLRWIFAFKWTPVGTPEPAITSTAQAP